MRAMAFSLKGIRSQSQGNQGFALMIVIVVMLLASFLASQLIFKVKAELVIAHNVKSRAIGNYLAEAGVNLGIFRLLDKPKELPDFGEEEEWDNFFEGFEYELFLENGRVAYYVANESGKIDLNKSNQVLIELFLEYHLGEESEDQIAMIVDSLLDWRDSDDLHRLNGAESETYEGLDDPYIAKNGPITDPSEFFLVNGTDSMREKFHAMDIFTVYNTAGKINFNSLTPAMLDFLTAGDNEKMEAYREAKKEFSGKLSSSLASEILGDRFAELSPYMTYSSGNVQYYYVVGSGQPGLTESDGEESEMDEDAPKTKVPGARNSVLIKKESSKYTYIAWREVYI